MITRLDQFDGHIVGLQPRRQTKRGLERYVRITLSMQQMDRTINRNRTAQQKMLPPLLDQPVRDDIRLITIGRRLFPTARPLKDGPFRCCRSLPYQILGKVRRRGNTDQTLDALWP